MCISATKIRKWVIRARIVLLVLYSLIWLTDADAQSNLVQNGAFLSGFTGWSGVARAIVNNPNAPNGVFGLVTDIYQNVPTTSGLQYEISFEAAADLFFGTNVDITLSLNNQPVDAFVTQPDTYNNQINRYSQMQWQVFSNVYEFTATSSSTRLEFIDANTFDFGLSDVSVETVPEPSCGILLLTAAGALMFIRNKGARHVA